MPAPVVRRRILSICGKMKAGGPGAALLLASVLDESAAQKLRLWRT